MGKKKNPFQRFGNWVGENVHVGSASESIKVNQDEENRKIQEEKDRVKAEELAKGQSEFQTITNDQKGIDDAYTGTQEKSGQELKTAGGVKDTNDNINDEDFKRKQQKLIDEATGNHKSSEKVYEDLTTRMTGQMDDADLQAKSAMTLQDYMNPDNKVAQDTRALYERQAQGEQNRGYADYGVLASLGSQSAANSMSGMGPMSLGQQMAYIGQGQGQAGEAYAAAQRRVQGLRDQGLQAGFDQSDKMYQAGQGAKDRQSRLVGQSQGLNESRNTAGANYRGERAGYEGNQYEIQRQIDGRPYARTVTNAGIDDNIAKTKHGFSSARNAGTLEERNAIRTITSNEAIADRNAKATERAAEKAKTGAIIQGVATVGGAAVAGPIGAAAANTVTAPNLTDNGTNTDYTPPNYTNYQSPAGKAPVMQAYAPPKYGEYQSPYGGRYGIKSARNG